MDSAVDLFTVVTGGLIVSLAFCGVFVRLLHAALVKYV